MQTILTEDIVKKIHELKARNYQRPHIKAHLEKNNFVSKIALSTISKALANKKFKKVSS